MRFQAFGGDFAVIPWLECAGRTRQEKALILPTFGRQAALCFVRDWVHHAAMNRIDIQPPLVSIEEDFALWCAQQGALLRAGRLSAIDRENLAEEVESLGRSDRREIGNRLKVLLAHLLKWQFQAEKQKGDWRATIRNQRLGIAKLIKESPSLRNYPASVLGEEYRHARADAADETELSEDIFPTECPFTIEQVLDPDWLPEAA